MVKLADIFKTQKPITKEEKEAVNRAYQTAVESAQKCLAIEEFQVYRKNAKKSCDLMIDELLRYENPDPIAKVVYLDKLRARINVLRSIFQEIEEDATMPGLPVTKGN